jgi:GGDEF domain-containing protein
MIAAPIPGDDAQRIEAMAAGFCAYVPREERFDRITRVVRRLLNVPIALVSMVERDVQWFRSAQGLAVTETARDISFCGHAVHHRQTMVVPDARHDARFIDNPLVTGPPHIAAYLGVPLWLNDETIAGTLCALDTQPRQFSPQDIAGLQDLAAIAQAELRLDTATHIQKRLVMKLGDAQRRANLDAVTGCWNVRGFRELLTLAVQEAREQETTLAVCTVRVAHLAKVSVPAEQGKDDLSRQLVAQVLRARLPPAGVLGMLSGSDFCALVPAMSHYEAENDVARLTNPTVKISSPGMWLNMDLHLHYGLAMLHEMPKDATANDLWARALSSPQSL